MESGTKSYWFVGASYGKQSKDQTDRFLAEGIWQNGYENKYLEIVRSIQPGDRIAIKSAYVRKHNLPFDNKEQHVAVMGIKAIGVVTRNHEDGRFVDVNWEPRFAPTKEWYFFTNRSTIWRVVPGEWKSDELLAFTFHGGTQDIDRFRNEPYWQERYGDEGDSKKRRFEWSRFYTEIADALLQHKTDREKLLGFVSNLADRFDLSYIKNKKLSDIDPFTVVGMFNRGITEENRKSIARELAEFLGVEESIPSSFEGIPILNNQKSWFFGPENRRDPDDIERLWSCFEKAIAFSDSDDSISLPEFCASYDEVAGQYGIGWNLTMALYWIRPWNFVTLDGQSQNYINKKLGIEITKNGPKGRCNSSDYLNVLNELELRFQEQAYAVHSFPDLSLAAWHYNDGSQQYTAEPNQPEGIAEEESEFGVIVPPVKPYGIDDIVTEGSFLGSEQLVAMVERLRTKKNIILQGPPGTGKTWLAKRLGYALIGQRDENKLRAVQFHPNLTYEDFVRGWRPSGEGRLSLVDGPFLEMISKARMDATTKYVVVIEEINRGNPAQIFGEMLTLLEADKRTPNEALELSYRRSDGETVYIPDNLYVVGTMNIADRSLALVDFALRRRFAFVDLKPVFGELWRNWVNAKAGIDLNFLELIEQRLVTLNKEIESDINLGAQFGIGHSYVTPAFSNKIDDTVKWYKSVVDTEIGPLLDEYWFDELERAQKARDDLIDGL
ncbi:MAG: 5-methylcytosine-specific restriction protein B [Candidatus Azotimanducaceae bacterium]|jgi:5-methylcytosine-specific restriction protein B